MDQQMWRALGRAHSQENGVGGAEPPLDPAVGLLLCDHTGRILQVNRVMGDFVGQSQAALVGHRHVGLLHPLDRDVDECVLRDLIGGKSSRCQVEARYLRSDGTVRWAAVRLSLLRPPLAPGPSQPLVMRRIVDITERRRIEIERDRFFDHSPAGIAVFGFNGKFKRVNRAVVDLLGWSEGQLVGRHWAELAHPDDRDGILETANRLAAEGSPIEYEGRVKTQAGDFRWIRFTAITVPDDELVYCWIIDIHKRMQAEALLTESEERFRRMFQGSPAGGALVDQSLRLQNANSALSRMLDRPTWTLEGASLAELAHPEDEAILSRVTRKALEGTIPGYEIEVRLLRRDGSVLWAVVRASVVRDANGQVLYILQIIEDISESREAENIHREVDQLKDRFVRVVSHDLQNPLLTIAQLANMAEREECDVDLHTEAVRRITAQATRLQHMLTHFVDLERLYHGNVASVPRATDIAALVSRVVERCDRGEHPVSVEVDPLVAEVDPDQVEHILENLLDNAFCHTPPGTSVWVRVGGASGALDITVEDAGPGVADELKARIFELFRTGAGGSSRTGVGLWVVARVAELQGGRAWVEDRPGGGARFCAVLHVHGDSGQEPTAADTGVADRERPALGPSDVVLTVE